MRRPSIATGLVTLAMTLGVAGALATGATGQPPEETATAAPVSFTLSSPPCGDLPAGTTVTGTGTSRTKTQVSVEEGVYRIRVDTEATGTATDNVGRTYRFDYENNFRISFKTLPAEGVMKDHFRLIPNGAGPKVKTAFNIKILVSSLDPFDFVVLSGTVQGDPINCDPI